MDSQFNFTLKYMYNLSYIQTLLFGKTVHLMDQILKCVVFGGGESCHKPKPSYGIYLKAP